MTSTVLQVPAPLRTFFAYFPLKTYPPVAPPIKREALHSGAAPTLWVLPPPDWDEKAADLLSADVECLKWQAYIALRLFATERTDKISVRWDIAPDGGIDGRLPCLHVPFDAAQEKLETGTETDTSDAEGEGELLAARMIPGWVDGRLGEVDELEGFRDSAAKDESRAWVAMLEGGVHAALQLAQPRPSLSSFLFFPMPGQQQPEGTVEPKGAGLSALLPASLNPWAPRVSPESIQTRYVEVIETLSERLGTDKWLLGSENPTAVDALLFAYLHCILNAKDRIRVEVTRHVNLVAWERRVASIVRAPFLRMP